MLIQNGNLFCDDGVFRRQNLKTDGGTISAIGSELAPGKEEVLDAEGCYVIPGLVDIHIHGAMGSDFSDGTTDSIHTIARFLLKNGITSFLGTSMALPGERLTEIFKTARPLFGLESAGGATLRGINMEGPFFNPEKRGAQNEKYIIRADFDLFMDLNEVSGGNIRTVAVAPEMAGGLEFVQKASSVCSVSLAHSCADYDTAHLAFANGADHVTHIFNGMPAFHHRDPGIVGAAAMDKDAYVELICDGTHVHPAMVNSVFRLFGDDRVCLISDAMRACGMPEGQYDLGGQLVTVANGAATIDSGSLAGSITVLTDCLRRAVQFGIPLESAVKAATINPAKSVGIADKVGSLSVGKRADILVLDREMALKYVIFGGILEPNP